MSGQARRIARLAVMTVLGALLLLLANVLPSGRLVIMLVASFPVCIALMMYGPAWSAAAFIVTAGLGFLLSPGLTAIGYAAFFGYYPIVKSLIERFGRRWLEVLLKGLLYAALFVLYRIIGRTMPAGTETALPTAVLFFAGAAAFAVYDFCYSLAIRFYLTRIARYFS